MGLVKSKHIHVLVVGINSSGKTSLIYQLKLGHNVLTLPTVGYQTEKVKLSSTEKSPSITFDMIDIGGASPIRCLWKEFTNKCDAIVYVVDAANRTTLQESALEFHKIMNERLAHHRNSSVPVLVFANKQDLPNAASVREVCELFHVAQDHDMCHVQSCCARDGSGLSEGMQWLKTCLSK